MIINLNEHNPQYINKRLEEIGTKISKIKTNDKFLTGTFILVPLISGLEIGTSIESANSLGIIAYGASGVIITASALITKIFQDKKREKLEEEYTDLYIKNEVNEKVEEEVKKRIRRRF